MSGLSHVGVAHPIAHTVASLSAAIYDEGAQRVVEVAGACSLAGAAVAIAALLYLHVAPTGLASLRTTVSQYGISAYRVWYRVVVIAMGVAGAGIAIALAKLPSSSGTGTVVVLLCVFAVCRYAISLVPIDAPGATRTSKGAAHVLLAVVAFASIADGAIRLCKVLEHDARLDLVATTSRVLGWLMVTLFALLFLSRLGPELRRYFGAIERALYAVMIVWLVVIGIACATGHVYAPPAVHFGV